MGIKSQILIQIPKGQKHITGEPIRGIVKFHLDKETVFKKISLSLIGKGYCSWSESALTYKARHISRHRRKVGNHYRFEGHEINVLDKLYFVNKDTDENVTLSFGSYEYPFEILIPENSPPSIKTPIGTIKYELILKFKKPGLFNWNKNFDTKLSIYPRVDSLITDGPVIFKLDKTITKMLSSDKQQINIKGELEKGYFNSSGERKISFAVTNNSDVTFTIKTQLISETNYRDDYVINGYAMDEPKTVREVVDYCTVKTPIIPDNSAANMFNIIPPVTSEHLTVRHSKIISREYQLKVTLKLPVPHLNESIYIPVFIGERFNDEDNVKEEAGETNAPIDLPPSYYEATAEDRSK